MKKPRPKSPGHTATFRGKLVWVQLKDGSSFTDRFIERTTGKRYLFKRHGLIGAGRIAKMITSPKIIRTKGETGA